MPIAAAASNALKNKKNKKDPKDIKKAGSGLGAAKMPRPPSPGLWVVAEGN